MQPGLANGTASHRVPLRSWSETVAIELRLGAGLAEAPALPLSGQPKIVYSIDSCWSLARPSEAVTRAYLLGYFLHTSHKGFPTLLQVQVYGPWGHRGKSSWSSPRTAGGGEGEPENLTFTTLSDQCRQRDAGTGGLCREGGGVKSTKSVQRPGLGRC